MDSTVSPKAHWRDYLELCKPSVVALMMLTAVIGMFLATPGMVPWQVLVFGNLGIALCAASAAAVNHLVDRRIDAVMARTRARPMVRGTVDTQHAIAFAAVLGVAGMAMLIVLVNPLTAWLTLASLVGYAFIYTFWLKRATPQNIVIGGLAGAAPPLLERSVQYDELAPAAVARIAERAQGLAMGMLTDFNRQAEAEERDDPPAPGQRMRMRVGVYFYSDPGDDTP